MERREDSFYTAYSYGDKLEEGHKLTLEHHISFDQRHADLSALTWMSLDRLQALRNKSVEAEKTVFRDLQEAAKRWEEQAAQTMILDRAIEYVKTPEVQHSSNRWEDTDYGWRKISNMVYQMSYRIREDTAYDYKQKKQVPVAWYVSWSVNYNVPRRKGPYSSTPSPLASQDNKRYTDKAAAERYVHRRLCSSVPRTVTTSAGKSRAPVFCEWAAAARVHRPAAPAVTAGAAGFSGGRRRAAEKRA